jgi:hypothetical protein
MPPLVPSTKHDDTSEENAACSMIAQIESNVAEVKDTLLSAKVLQAFFANKTCGHKDPYLVGDHVMLATLHHCREYKAGGLNKGCQIFPSMEWPLLSDCCFS